MDPWTIAYIVMIVISVAVAIINRPKTKNQKPQQFDDKSFPQSDEGTTKSVVFGQVWTKDWTVLTSGNYRTRPIRTKSSKK